MAFVILEPENSARDKELMKTYRMADVVGSELGHRQQDHKTMIEEAYLYLVTFLSSSWWSGHDACIVHQDILLGISISTP